jgi:hypothetical protein
MLTTIRSRFTDRGVQNKGTYMCQKGKQMNKNAENHLASESFIILASWLMTNHFCEKTYLCPDQRLAKSGTHGSLLYSAAT